VLKKFDAWIQKVATSRALKAADRLSLTDDLREERKLFAEKEDMAENSSNDVLSVMLGYGKAVAKKYKPVSSMFDQMMTARINAGKTEEAKKIKADMELFENEHLPGRKHVAAGGSGLARSTRGTARSSFSFGSRSSTAVDSRPEWRETFPWAGTRCSMLTVGSMAS
jgi:hypothetical protein